MKHFPIHSTFRWLLTAWMLVATTVMSSTYVHNHNGGNLAHNHDGHGNPPSSLSSAIIHQDSHQGDLILTAVDTHQHGCLMLLGSLSYRSLPDTSSNSQKGHPFGWETTVTASLTQDVRLLARSLAPDFFGLASALNLPPGCAIETKPIGYSCAGTTKMPFLCDRARHERSGVLLA
jgi:hypothetical protein